MEKREIAKQDTLKLLRSINTIDDLKAHENEILDLIDDIFKFGMESIRDFFEGSFSPGEKQEEMAKFQDDSYFFDSDIEKELDRIADLPGAGEYFETFKEEVEIRIRPHLEEFALQMARSMGDLMGDMMEGLGDMMEGMNEFVGEPGSMEERRRSDELYFLYDVKTLDDLKEHEDDISEILFDQLNSDLGELRDIKEVDFPLEEIKDRLDEIEDRIKLIESEFELEFNRIQAIPEISDYAKSVEEKMENQMTPIINEIKELLIDLKKTN